MRLTLFPRSAFVVHPIRFQQPALIVNWWNSLELSNQLHESYSYAPSFAAFSSCMKHKHHKGWIFIKLLALPAKCMCVCVCSLRICHCRTLVAHAVRRILITCGLGDRPVEQNESKIADLCSCDPKSLCVFFRCGKNANVECGDGLTVQSNRGIKYGNKIGNSLNNYCFRIYRNEIRCHILDLVSICYTELLS